MQLWIKHIAFHLCHIKVTPVSSLSWQIPRHMLAHTGYTQAGTDIHVDWPTGGMKKAKDGSKEVPASDFKGIFIHSPPQSSSLLGTVI